MAELAVRVSHSLFSSSSSVSFEIRDNLFFARAEIQIRMNSSEFTDKFGLSLYNRHRHR